jgi:energy-converting hydrogenase Eha subunit B
MQGTRYSLSSILLLTVLVAVLAAMVGAAGAESSQNKVHAIRFYLAGGVVLGMIVGFIAGLFHASLATVLLTTPIGGLVGGAVVFGSLSWMALPAAAIGGATLIALAIGMRLLASHSDS